MHQLFLENKSGRPLHLLEGVNIHVSQNKTHSGPSSSELPCEINIFFFLLISSFWGHLGKQRLK